MISWFVRHPTAANLLMAAIILLGVVTLPGLQRETFPEIKSDKVQVSVISSPPPPYSSFMSMHPFMDMAPKVLL